MIPSDSGYSLADGKVHTRYPKHPTTAPPRRARTQAAVLALTDTVVICGECYPETRKETKRGPRPKVSRSPKPTMPTDDDAAKVPSLPDRVESASRIEYRPRIRDEAPGDPQQDADQD